MDVSIKNNDFENISFGISAEKTKVNDNSYYLNDKIDWVIWGDENLYPNQFIRFLDGCGLYYRICSVYANLIAGNELSIEGGNEAGALSKLEELGVNNFLPLLAYDLAVFNGFSAEIRKFGNKDAYISRIPLNWVRVDKNNMNYILPSEINKRRYWVSQGWNRVNLNGKVSQRYKEYRPASYMNYSNNGNKTQLYYGYLENSNAYYYPNPDGNAIKNEIELDMEITNFHKSNIRNSISSNMIILYPKSRNPDNQKEFEERKLIADSMRENFTSSKKAGTAMIAFYDQTSQKVPEVIAIPTDTNDKKFEITQKTNVQKILTGLGVVVPEQFGILTNSGFSPKSETILVGQELTMYNVINQKKALLEKFLNQILEFNGFSGSEAKIITSTPVSDAEVDDNQIEDDADSPETDNIEE